MRFRSLYRYSYGKSPRDLQPAIAACKLTLVLAILASALLIIALLTYLYHSSISQLVPIADFDNSTSAKQTDSHEEQQEHQSSFVQYITEYSVITCLAGGVILLLVALTAIAYAYLTYRRYLESRLVAYQLVNRSFDQLQMEQLAKVYVRQPIVTKSSGKGTATVLVPKTSPVPDWIQRQMQEQSEPTTRAKIVAWARLKLLRQGPRAGNNNNVRHPTTQRSISKDMTI